MGNTEGILKNYELEKHKERVHEDWSLIPGKVNQTSICMFSAHLPKSSKKHTYIERAFQSSKVYRHPGLLRYLDGGISNGEIVIITEDAVPLPHYNLQLLSPLQITSGLLSIIDALIFLHDKAGVSHNNVCASSIYITSEGIWKLWGLEYLCSFAELTRDHIEKINQYCYEPSIPPEDKSQITPAYQHARDSYAIAKFILTHLFPLFTKEISGMSEFLTTLEAFYVNSDWSKRPRLLTLSQHAFFRHEFLQLKNDITNILLLPENQKEAFIRSLPEKLQVYPEKLVASTLAHTLLSRPLLLTPSANQHLLPALLTPKKGAGEACDEGLFSIPVFVEFIIPIIVQLFAVHDATIRTLLLSCFSTYAHLIDKSALTKEVLPELLLGIRDTNESLVASTLECLSCLIPIIGADIVIGRNREQLFTTSKPKVIKYCSTTGLATSNLISLDIMKQAPSANIAGQCDLKTAIAEDASSLDGMSLQDLSISYEIPERSSPDGGEVEIEDQVGSLCSTKAQDLDTGPEQWSDWEELQESDQPHTSGNRNECTFDVLHFDLNHKDVVNPVDPASHVTSKFEGLIANKFQISKDDASNFRHDIPLAKDFVTYTTDAKHFHCKKGSAMKLALHTNPSLKYKSSAQGLGEEYDIMSIQVKRQPDLEMDLFADIKPTISTKSYDLEHMLQEANKKTRSHSSTSSLSAIMADPDLSHIQEGEGWMEGSEWADPQMEENLNEVLELNKSVAKGAKTEINEISLWDDDWGDVN